MISSTVPFDFDLTLFDTDGAEAPANQSTIAQMGLEQNLSLIHISEPTRPY